MNSPRGERTDVIKGEAPCKCHCLSTTVCSNCPIQNARETASQTLHQCALSNPRAQTESLDGTCSLISLSVSATSASRVRISPRLRSRSERKPSMSSASRILLHAPLYGLAHSALPFNLLQGIIPPCPESINDWHRVHHYSSSSPTWRNSVSTTYCANAPFPFGSSIMIVAPVLLKGCRLAPFSAPCTGPRTRRYRRTQKEKDGCQNPTYSPCPYWSRHAGMRVVGHVVAFLDWLVAGPTLACVYPSLAS